MSPPSPNQIRIGTVRRMPCSAGVLAGLLIALASGCAGFQSFARNSAAGSPLPATIPLIDVSAVPSHSVPAISPLGANEKDGGWSGLAKSRSQSTHATRASFELQTSPQIVAGNRPHPPVPDAINRSPRIGGYGESSGGTSAGIALAPAAGISPSSAAEPRIRLMRPKPFAGGPESSASAPWASEPLATAPAVSVADLPIVTPGPSVKPLHADKALYVEDHSSASPRRGALSVDGVVPAQALEFPESPPADSSDRPAMSSSDQPARAAASPWNWHPAAPAELVQGIALSSEAPGAAGPLRPGDSSAPSGSVTADAGVSGNSRPLTDENTAAGSAPSVTTPEREPSMMERLRVLYTPRREDGSAETLRNPFRRLPSPWGLLREKDPEQPVAADQLAEVPSPGSSAAREDTAPDALAPAISTGLAPVIATLEAQLQAWPRDGSGQPADLDQWRRAQTDLRLLYLVAERPGEAVSAIESLPPEEQEFWQSLMLAMTYYRNSAPEGTSREEQLAATGDQLRSAMQHISGMTAFAIRRMAFCSAINSFGNVDGFPSADFDAGQTVLIYAEIENFRSERTRHGTWKSEFSAVLEISRHDDAEPIESIRIGEIVDESARQRTDYFQSYELTIPQLAKGRYTAQIRLRDKNSLQQAQAALDFNIR